MGLNEEMKEIENAIILLNKLVTHLQVYGYEVHINNHNLCDYHNVSVFKYVPLKKKWWWFGINDTIYTKQSVFYTTMRLPSSVNELKESLILLLEKEGVSRNEI